MHWNSLMQPKSIAVIGGSDRLDHLGGSIVHNLLSSDFQGDLFIVNPKRDVVQGLKAFRDPKLLPDTELAIFAIPADPVFELAELLIASKNTKALIVFSAGFSEAGQAGCLKEKALIELCDRHQVLLLGPNCIGLCNQHYTGLFTRPLPKIDKKGVDFISSSGATAVFTMELASEIGLSFSSLYTVGNAAQTGVEDLLEYFDKTYQNSERRVIMIYLEGMKDPQKFIDHCRSLYQKGHRITLLKGGITDQGNKAASSHTGALARKLETDQSIFKKAGVILCNSRTELIYTSAVINSVDRIPQRVGIITHAGGPAVLLTDGLIKNGLTVPSLNSGHQRSLKETLFNGASTSNPIDILATGTSDQLEKCMSYCDQEIDDLDGLIVILGSPGLTDMTEHFQSVLSFSKSGSKPLFAIFPSVINTAQQRLWLSENDIPAFKDEQLFANSLGAIKRHQFFESAPYSFDDSTVQQLKDFISHVPDGYINEAEGARLLDIIGISRVAQRTISSCDQLKDVMTNFEYPVVLKAGGLQHKTDQKGVFTNLRNIDELVSAYESLVRIDKVEYLILQPQLFGEEIYIGALRDDLNSPLVFCGKGGVDLETYADIQHTLAPVSMEEATNMVQQLKIFPILKGTRGKSGVDLNTYILYIAKIAALVDLIPRIQELDINPLIADDDSIYAVDFRVNLET